MVSSSKRRTVRSASSASCSASTHARARTPARPAGRGQPQPHRRPRRCSLLHDGGEVLSACSRSPVAACEIPTSSDAHARKGLSTAIVRRASSASPRILARPLRHSRARSSASQESINVLPSGRAPSKSWTPTSARRSASAGRPPIVATSAPIAATAAFRPSASCSSSQPIQRSTSAARPPRYAGSGTARSAWLRRRPLRLRCVADRRLGCPSASLHAAARASSAGMRPGTLSSSSAPRSSRQMVVAIPADGCDRARRPTGSSVAAPRLRRRAGRFEHGVAQRSRQPFKNPTAGHKSELVGRQRGEELGAQVLGHEKVVASEIGAPVSSRSRASWPRAPPGTGLSTSLRRVR